MKNLSKEDLEFLTELSKKINKQDKRSTSYVYFMVRDREKEYGEEDYGFDEKERKDSDCLNTVDLCSECEKLWEEDKELPDDCDECHPEAYHWFKWVNRIQIEDGVFLTAEACDEYIQRRIYNFNKPHSYGLSNYRSDEMRRVQEIISRLTTDEELLR